MLKRHILALTLTLLTPYSNAAETPTTTNELDKLLPQYRNIFKEFSTAMQGELQQAIQQHHAADAMGVCSSKAPELAKITAEKYQLQISRTALKTRNANNNPNADEQAILQTFIERHSKGEDLMKVEQIQTVKTADGNAEVLYMKAIPTGAVCLTCHGETIDAKVTEKIKELYPADQATGFKLGELRGAFIIRQPLTAAQNMLNK